MINYREVLNPILPAKGLIGSDTNN